MLGTVPPLIPLEAEYDKCRTPKIPGLGLVHFPLTHLDPASTNCWSTKKQGLHATGPGVSSPLILYITMVSRDGRPFSGHVATATSTALDKTSLLRHPPASLPPLDLIKGKAGDSTKGRGRKEKEKPSHHPTEEDQHLKQSPLYSHFLSET
jgi:hypothetical protein